ncbi:peptidyl-prolyl cis-trans isomerase CYP59 [Amborella trichopoda]|uniref:peptidyl-prolyl cis-trans isomerase CYP59 n=1 Tax=Amborella trichopoda TaxID=13333 RepID=UPI0005D3721F|nr:peptidyl-prolyl cis-trans isomerase CYP59 [Amborella trichopoda]|eukprot:XP_011626683.1 peptidyl-prolyl cis-trans isomerase CYP59 [Amborella trichopoda]
MSVLLVTSLGDIVVDLNTDRCPLTSKNFLKLCNHLMCCSLCRFLYGDQARFFGDEIHPDLKHSKTGTLSMASAGENLNASQFYFTLRDDLDYLDGKHTVFGEVAEGLETLMRINEAFVDEKGRPYKNIRIKHTYILDDPFDDPPQLVELIPDASPEGKPANEMEEVRLEDDWVPMDEQMDPKELEELVRKKEAQSRAVVLEMIGDIPDAEIKPPENVLFVCKLNPVTQEEDLEIIFSRFGKVISADIIRDYKTGDSLCYAFIEFETEESCEAAYFKMDNVLIDDRRIHVDFSQSVSKLWSQYKRGGKSNQGSGCFKCGALDHLAKDCSEGSERKGNTSKYVLKNTNTQRGDSHKSYDMVFDGEDTESPQRGEGKHTDHKREVREEEQRTHNRNSDHPRPKDPEKTNWYRRQREEPRSEERNKHKDKRREDHKDGSGMQDHRATENQKRYMDDQHGREDRKRSREETENRSRHHDHYHSERRPRESVRHDHREDSRTLEREKHKENRREVYDDTRSVEDRSERTKTGGYKARDNWKKHSGDSPMRREEREDRRRHGEEREYRKQHGQGREDRKQHGEMRESQGQHHDHDRKERSRR